MFRLILAIFFVAVFTHTLSAQRIDNRGWGWGGHSSTALEGYLRGRGAAARGYGDWLYSLGQYQNLHQQARQKYIQNEAERTRTRWDLIEERNARIKAAHPPYHERESARLDREEKRLEVDSRNFALEQKKKRMIEDGLMPGPKKYVYKGVEYESYVVFKKTDAYKKRKELVRTAIIDSQKEWVAKKAAEKQKQAEAAAWLSGWNAKSPSQRRMETERKRRQQRLRVIMGEEWWEEYGEN